MKPRAIMDLCQLTEPDLLREISTGMDLAISNALTIEHDARKLYDMKSNSYDILMAVACEEAAKALILFDAVRCPSKSPHFERQLKRFNDHLAKGIYAEMCEWEPASKKELQRYVALEREKFYLDGPNDVDWRFYNRILHSRERNMYVDYVKSSEGHIWLEPFKHERAFSHHKPRVVSIVESLQVTRCIDAHALALIAAIWRPTSIDNTWSRQQLRELNHHMMVELEKHNLTKEADDTTIGLIINYLPFPLHDTDLSLLEVDTEELERNRASQQCA